MFSSHARSGREFADAVCWMTVGPWTIVARIGPQLPGLGSLAPWIEHRRRRFVGEQPLRPLQPLEEVIGQRTKIPGFRPSPVGQGGSIKLDTMAGVDLRLAVKRQVIGILDDQHLCDQRRGGNATLNDPSQCRSMHDSVLTRAAALAWALESKRVSLSARRWPR